MLWFVNNLWGNIWHGRINEVGINIFILTMILLVIDAVLLFLGWQKNSAVIVHLSIILNVFVLLNIVFEYLTVVPWTKLYDLYNRNQLKYLYIIPFPPVAELWAFITHCRVLKNINTAMSDGE